MCSAVLLALLPQADVLAASKMYWTNWSNSKIQCANLDGTNAENFVIAGYPFGIALDIAAGKMYWTDWVSDKIQRANLDGSGVQNLVTAGLHMPYGIALDVLRGRMYWADAGSNIKRANLDGSGVEDLFILGVDSPRGITLDVAGGKMYWTDDNGRIQRANLDGSGAEDLITSLTSPSGIALDIAAGKIYWTEDIASGAKIRRANLDGDNVQTLVTNADGLYWPCDIALDVAADKMYWTDYDTGKIQRANLDGTQVEDLIIDLDTPFGIALDTASEIMTVYYVDDDAPGSNNGTSWTNALNDLQDALSIAAAYPQVEQILVAQGTYKPDQGFGITPGDRSATFQLINGITIKGGYAGYSEPNPNARYIKGYETILSGDLAGNDGPDFANNGENSYHVVTGSDCNETAVLDGFTTTAGNADGPYPDPENFGGGMYNDSGSPTVTNCTFSENSANIGGGMFNYSGSPTVTNCIFSGNSAAYDGGGMHNRNDNSPTLVNCTFSENSAGGLGGGIFSDDNCSPIITNSILWNNTAADGPQIAINDCTLTVSYSDVQGGELVVYVLSSILNWSDNIDADPLFVDADGDDDVAGTKDDNLRLWACSPCIDAGDNTAVPPSLTTDLDGRPRFLDDSYTPDTGNGTPPIVDMGAYEAGSAPCEPTCYPGNALWFDGIDDRVRVPDDDSLNPRNEITISFWIYHNSGGASPVISKMSLCPNEQYSPGNSRAYDIGVRDGIVRFRIFQEAFDYEWIFSNSTVPLNQWHHITGTFDRGDIAIYIDGQLDNSDTLSVSRMMNDVQPLFIGGYWRFCDSPDIFVPALYGAIDEVAIFNRALSAEEVQQLYCCGSSVCVADANLAAYWNFDEGWGQVVHDLSGNGNDGYLGTNPDDADDADPAWLASDIPRREFYVDNDAPDDPAPGVSGASVGEPNLSDPLEDGRTCHPFDSIQKAIDEAAKSPICCHLTVTVLDGTYTGIGNYNIDPNGLALTIKSENGPKDCIIDCRNQGRAFIFQTGEEPNTIIDGFTITNGYTSQSGGAIYCYQSSPTIEDCTIRNSYAEIFGGAISCYQSSSPVIDNCIITNNYADWSGGGIDLDTDCNALISRCTVTNNRCNGSGAGICSVERSSPEIKNCLIAYNEGGFSGGASSIWQSNMTFTNCTIVDNSAKNLEIGIGGVYCWDANATIINTILWDNYGCDNSQIRRYLGYEIVTVTYSDVQILDSNGLITDYNWPGAGNINADPLFADPNIRDYHLKSIAGRWTPVLETNGDFNNDGIIDWFDLEIFVLYWLGTGPQIIADLYVDNSVDFKDYAILAANWLSPGNNIAGWIYTDDQTSPCIDTGDPNFVYPLEPEPNGDRINMGAYGNTKHASKSPP